VGTPNSRSHQAGAAAEVPAEVAAAAVERSQSLRKRRARPLPASRSSHKNECPGPVAPRNSNKMKPRLLPKPPYLMRYSTLPQTAAAR